MITGTYTVIRSADPDDARDLRRFYNPSRPRPALLDRRREVPIPTLDELRESLSQKEIGADLYVVEDLTGTIRGYCTLRTASAELRYAEIMLLLHDDADYETPLAAEAMETMIQLGFQEKGLRKILAHTLEVDAAFHRILVARGFKSDGVQREILYFEGRFHDMETLSLFNDQALS